MYVRPIPRIRRPVGVRANSNVRHVLLSMFTTKLDFRYILHTYTVRIKLAPEVRVQSLHLFAERYSTVDVLAGRKALAL